jgi:hypothetical protein
MDERGGSELWFGGMNRTDGLEGGSGGMDCRYGLEGWSEGWTDRRDVVLLYLFYFREKRNFRIFVGHFREK